jgi:non-homologous end joining protein Ku
MASTIRTIKLVCGGLAFDVALRGASEKRDVTLDRAAASFVGGSEDDPAALVEVAKRICRIDVVDPGPDAEGLTIERLSRKKGKIEQQQFYGEPLRGVWDGDEFHKIEPEEIELIDDMTRLDTLTFQEFVLAADVPWERAVASYFLLPANGTVSEQTKMVTLREAMERRGVVAVAKLMPKSRQKLAVIYPKHGGLMVTCLAYADTYAQVLDGAASLDGVVVPDKAVALAEQLIGLMLKPASVLDEYRDDLIDLKADLVERAKLGEPLVDPEVDVDVDGDEVATVPAPTALEDLLQATLDALKPKVAPKKKSTAKKPSVKSPSRRTAATK